VQSLLFFSAGRWSLYWVCPFGALVGGTLGWRSAFAAVGFLRLLSAAWVWRALPNGVKLTTLSMATWKAALQSPALMLCIAVTELYSAGQFVLFSYLAPYFKASIHITPVQLSLLFMWFGAFGFIGNVLMARRIDRIGASRAVMLGIARMAVSQLL
jgi:predicted MFS family arabinose efflux permease